MKRFALSYCLMLATTLRAALFTGGDFTSATEKLSPLCRTNGGRISLFTEKGNWNRAVRLEVSSFVTNKAGHVTAVASCWIGSESGKNGFAVKPDTEYSFSVELRGDAPSANVGFIEWTGPHTWKDLKNRKTSVGSVRLQKEWTVYEGMFRTGKDAQRAVLHVQLYSSTVYGPMRLKVGDYVLIDNVSVRERPSKDLSALARERAGAPYVVATVPVASAMTLPFLPDEIFAPEVREFRLVAAVNEKKAFPVAIANLTDAPSEYRVILETDGDAAAAAGDGFYKTNGRRGLAGFPPERIEFRRAVAVRDSNSKTAAGLCLDPLPLMDEACIVPVPAKSVRLAWFDFDAAGTAPGEYSGRLRVLPLSERGEWIADGGYNRRRYQGAAKDYPVTLEVLPLTLPEDPPVPSGFFQHAVNEKMFDAMLSLGAREMGISPYSFGFVRTAGGTDFTRLNPGSVRSMAHVRKMLGWAEKRRVKLTWFIGFSAYRSLGDVLGGRRFGSREEHLSAFVEWTGAVKREMTALGIADRDFAIETWDEPEKEFAAEMLAAHTALKKSLPTVQLTVTLGAQGFPFETVEKLAPVTDGWTLWDHGYFSRPDHLAFIRRTIAEGKRVSHYTCSTGSGMMRGERTRTYRHSAWKAAAYGLTGNDLFWFSDAPGGYGAQDWKTAPIAGLFYRSFDSFVPSVRAMVYREGVTDMRYLAALEALAADDAEIRRFLAEAPLKVVRDQAHDRCAPDRIRAKVQDIVRKR